MYICTCVCEYSQLYLYLGMYVLTRGGSEALVGIAQARRLSDVHICTHIRICMYISLHLLISVFQMAAERCWFYIHKRICVYVCMHVYMYWSAGTWGATATSGGSEAGTWNQRTHSHIRIYLNIGMHTYIHTYGHIDIYVWICTFPAEPQVDGLPPDATHMRFMIVCIYVYASKLCL